MSGRSVGGSRPVVAAELIALDGPHEGTRYPLDLERWKVSELIVGRSKGSHILLHDVKVSKHHGRFFRDSGCWFVEDLDSRNGVFLNGARIARHALEPDDEVRIGNTAFRFVERERPGRAEPIAAEAARSSSGAAAAEGTESADPAVEARGPDAVARADRAPEPIGGSSDEIRSLVASVQDSRERIRAELAKVIVGQEEVIDEVLIGLLARGHCLLEGVPGLAKTLLVATLAEVLELEFKRIQFTPDLMPADITGTEVLEEDPATRHRSYKFIPGPIFTNILLADEINRTPPKTQAALLEAMQEFRVTAGGKAYPITPPFFVLATQNPIEQEGTYSLPEAQLDRFMLKIRIAYPSREEEIEILRATTLGREREPGTVLAAGQVLQLQTLTRKLPVSDHVLAYAADLARATRPGEPEALEAVRRYVVWGGGPRAAQCLTLGAKARALLDGRYNVTTEDVRRVARAVLRHRVGLNFRAASDGIDPDALVERVLREVADPAAGRGRRSR